MPWFKRHPSPRLRQQLLEEVTKAIELPRNGGGSFAPRDRLARIWTSDVLRKFFHGDTLLSRPSFIRDIRRDFLQTISILISVQWDEWSRFDEIFFSHKGPDQTLDRSDLNIRYYDLQTLTSNDFLGPVTGFHFYETRYIFCPVDIEEESHRTYEEGWRLPFLPAESEVRGSGGFGRITREVIAPTHYRPRSGTCVTKVEVARKLFRSKLDYDRERIILKRLRESAAQHKHIVLPIATITIGHQSNILFPLAKMDLEQFLAERPIPPRQCNMDEVLDELTNLAGALDHLHNRLGVSTRGYHMDLKPANILVYEYPESLNPRRIGKWMITDFGLCIIEGPEKRNSLEGLPRDPVTETRTQLQRMEGTYQAPEVRTGPGVSRRSDVWSFGCIMVRVFAFALAGIDELQRLDRLRSRNDDGFGLFENDHFARGTPPVLNPHIENWIRNLPHHCRGYNEEFVNGCAKLLLSITPPLTILFAVTQKTPKDKMAHDGSFTPGIARRQRSVSDPGKPAITQSSTSTSTSTEPASPSTAGSSQATPTRGDNKRPLSPSQITNEPRKKPNMSATAILEDALKQVKEWEQSQQSSLSWVAIAEKIIEDGKKQHIKSSEECIKVLDTMRAYRSAVDKIFNDLEKILYDLHHERPWIGWQMTRHVVSRLMDANEHDCEGVKVVRAKLEAAEFYESDEE